MAMTKPSVEASRLATVQRAAKYVLSMDAALAQGKGDVAFGSMDVFPPDLDPAPRASPEYTWRWQLAWVWARAGFFKETMTGAGINKHREYILLPKGRAALARIAAEPVLASFYVSSKRTAASKDERPPSYFQPPELVPLMYEPPPPPLRLVKEDEPGEASEPEEEAPEEEATNEPAPEDGGLKDLPVFLERITLVLESFGERLAGVSKLGARIDKIEDEVKGQGEYLLGILQSLQNIEEGLKPAPAPAPAEAPATREDLARVAGEMTEAFIRDNPQNSTITALGARVAEHAEAQDKVAREVAGLAALVKEKISKPYVEAALRDAISTEIAAVFLKELPKSVVSLVRTAVSEEIGHGVDPVVQAIVLAEGTIKGSLKEDREALEARLAALLPKKTLEKLEKAVLGSCAEIRDELSEIGGAAADLSDNLEKINANFVEGGKEFRRQGDEIVEVTKRNIDTIQSTTDAARAVLDAANAVAKEMIFMARARATDAGIPFETALEIGNSIIRSIAAASDKLGSSAATSLGGGLIRPIPNDELRPVILPRDEDEEGGAK
jgi:hypothetical protein